MDSAGKKKIRSLASMLDDPDDYIAVEVMAELLSCGEEISGVLAELQESEDPAVRKRVQQLESILELRRRRREFFKLLEKPGLSPEEGLCAVHLLWFDNDNVVALQEGYRKFFAGLEKFSCGSLDEAAYVLNKMSLKLEKESIQEPELYCIGAVIGDRRAAGSMAALLLCELGRRQGRQWQVIELRGDFGVYDAEAGAVLMMKRSCRAGDITEAESLKCLTLRQILRYFGLMLFSHAVISDNFRYVHTIGQSLSGGGEEDGLDFLPYPYFPAPEEEEDAPEEEAPDGGGSD